MLCTITGYRRGGAQDAVALFYTAITTPTAYVITSKLIELSQQQESIIPARSHSPRQIVFAIAYNGVKVLLLDV